MKYKYNGKWIIYIHSTTSWPKVCWIEILSFYQLQLCNFQLMIPHSHIFVAFCLSLWSDINHISTLFVVHYNDTASLVVSASLGHSILVLTIVLEAKPKLYLVIDDAMTLLCERERRCDFISFMDFFHWQIFFKETLRLQLLVEQTSIFDEMF